MLRNPLLSNATKSSLDNEFKNSFPIPIIILVYGIELTNIASVSVHYTCKFYGWKSIDRKQT